MRGILIAALLLVANASLATEGALGLFVRDGSLLRRLGKREEHIIRAVTPDEAESAASVRLVRSIVRSRDGRVAAVLVSRNRSEELIAVRLNAEGRLQFAWVSSVPWATEVFLSPDAGLLLEVSEEDLYLPREAEFLLNRGAMLIALGDLDWKADPCSALRGRSHDPWYGRSTERFVPADDFATEKIRWLGNGECDLMIRRADGRSEEVRLRN